MADFMRLKERFRLGRDRSRSLTLFSTRIRPATVAAVAITAVSVTGYSGIGYLHYKRIATDERIAAERAEQANAHLQDALARLHDEVAVMMFRFNARGDEATRLTSALAERDAAIAEPDNLRVRAGDLEQKLALLQPRQGLRASRKAALGQPMPLRGRAVSASFSVGSTPAPDPAAPAMFKNFTAPGWVPNYFSGETRDLQ